MKNWLKIPFALIFSWVALLPLSMAQSKTNKQPEFVGGTDALATYFNQNIKYPSSAKQSSIEGVVYVSFIVNADGSLTNVEAKKAQYQKVSIDAATKKPISTPTDSPSDRSMEKEAVRVVKAMPKWSAGETDGKKTSFAYMLPVSFSLN